MKVLKQGDVIHTFLMMKTDALEPYPSFHDHGERSA